MFCVILVQKIIFSKYLLQDLIHKLNILLNLLDLDTINYLIKHQRHTLDALNSLIQLSFGLWSCCTKFSIRHLRLILMWKNVGIDKSLMLKISLSHMTRNKKTFTTIAILKNLRNLWETCQNRAPYHLSLWPQHISNNDRFL